MDDLITILMAVEGVVLGLMGLVVVLGIGGDRNRYHCRAHNVRLRRP
ncbi:MAG: hypothetical protein ABI724_18225 [Betaproteobacteria bacterium]